MARGDLSRSDALAARVIFAALQVLKEAGGSLPSKETVDAVPSRVVLDEWALGRSQKSGRVRWQSMLNWFSVDYVKAGYLVKKKGIWYLTPDGDAALKLGEVGMYRQAGAAYARWEAERGTAPEAPEARNDEAGATQEEDGGAGRSQEVVLDEIEQRARDSFMAHLQAMNPYDFQDLVGALLRGMGYYTPFIAPRGKDGGVDVIAYKDPLGSSLPRIKVQIKHRESTSGAKEIRELKGLLQRDGDVGIFVSTGGFSSDARTEARGSHVHLELIDIDRFIELWQEFYDRLRDEDKVRMPLRRIYFVDPVV